MSDAPRTKLSDIQQYCYDRNMNCSNCIYRDYNPKGCKVKNSIIELIVSGNKPRRFKEKGIEMDDRGFKRASDEYEYKMSEPLKDYEEEYDAEEDYMETQADIEFEENRLREMGLI